VKTEEITLRNTFCADERLCFLAEKSHHTLLRGWPRGTKYQISVIRHYSPPLFATIRDCSPLSAIFATVRTIRTIRDYSLFPNRVFQTPHFMGVWSYISLQLHYSYTYSFHNAVRFANALSGKNVIALKDKSLQRGFTNKKQDKNMLYF